MMALSQLSATDRMGAVKAAPERMPYQAISRLKTCSSIRECEPLTTANLGNRPGAGISFE